MLTGACTVNQLFDHTGDEITLGDVERITICDEARRAIPGFLEGRQEPEPGATEGVRRGSASARRLVVLSVADVRAPGGALP